MSTVRSAKIAAALNMVQGIADAIQELGQVPSGTLYANVLSTMTLEEYDWIIGKLIGAGLVHRDNSHLLTWIG